jgi:hypothetical protein
VLILVGVNFDLRLGTGDTSVETVLAFIVAKAAYLFAMFGILFACWVLFAGGVLSPVVRETAKGHLDGVHHFDRLTAAQPCGDFIRW